MHYIVRDTVCKPSGVLEHTGGWPSTGMSWILNCTEAVGTAGEKTDELKALTGQNTQLAEENKALEEQNKALEELGSNMTFLASIGSNAPFIGLFGTVWGIMNSFIAIANTQTTSLAVVAPGIAEALFATAAGLVAAIPAVLIYNFSAKQTGTIGGYLEDFEADFISLVTRDMDKQG